MPSSPPGDATEAGRTTWMAGEHPPARAPSGQASRQTGEVLTVADQPAGVVVLLELPAAACGHDAVREHGIELADVAAREQAGAQGRRPAGRRGQGYPRRSFA